MVEFLSPKKIIISQLKARFKQAEIKRVVLTYNMNNKTASCIGKQLDNSEIAIPVEKDELSLIEKFLIGKILKKAKTSKELIVDFNIESEKLEMYCKLENNEIKRLQDD